MAGRSDPHFNIFHAYRGAAVDEAARSRQIEDNLTRALGILLSRVRGTELATPFLRELGVAPSLVNQQFEVQFQTVAAGATWPPPGNRSLVAIVAGGPDFVGEESARDGASPAARPDLVILWESHALVVESEITSKPDYKQMNRMRAAFLTEAAHGNYGVVRWRQLARLARSLNHQATQPNRYVLEAFEEYMKLNGFGGFADEHFAYFALSAERRRLETVTRIGAKRALVDLLSDLQAGWKTSWEGRVGNLHEGDLEMWGRLSPAGGAAPHLSISVDASGLRLFANVETLPSVRKFEAAWKRAPKDLIALLAKLGEDDNQTLERSPWNLQVRRRLQRTGSNGEKMPQKFWYLPMAAISASAIDRTGGMISDLITDALRFNNHGEASPEITVERHYEPWMVLADDFIDRMVNDARRLEGFFDWLGQPVRSSTV